MAVADVLLLRRGFGDVGQGEVVFDEAFFHGGDWLTDGADDRDGG